MKATARALAALVIPLTVLAASPAQATQTEPIQTRARDVYVTAMTGIVDAAEFATLSAINAGDAVACPVPGSTFVPSFGAPRVGHLHQGTDMMAPDGTPILAPQPGRYEQHGPESFYLYTDAGDVWFGTHLQEHVAASGRVAAGDLIALVGHTGNASPDGPHLHAEIHPGGGTAVDPYPTLADACLGNMGPVTVPVTQEDPCPSCADGPGTSPNEPNTNPTDACSTSPHPPAADTALSGGTVVQCPPTSPPTNCGSDQYPLATTSTTSATTPPSASTATDADTDAASSRPTSGPCPPSTTTCGPHHPGLSTQPRPTAGGDTRCPLTSLAESVDVVSVRPPVRRGGSTPSTVAYPSGVNDGCPPSRRGPGCATDAARRSPQTSGEERSSARRPVVSTRGGAPTGELAAARGVGPSTVRFCRLAGTGARFVRCLHRAEGHRQWRAGRGTPGHTWAAYRAQARQLRRYLNAAARPTIPFEANWDRVAACESGGDWSINTGNGFYGGLQFDYGTWLGAGGGAFAQRADLASKAEQVTIAERVRADRGLAPWPHCGPRWYG